MENEGGSSRPFISFPLGLALLVIFLICISGFFSCCYNWNKLRRLLNQPASNSTPENFDENHSSDRSTLPHSITNKQPERKPDGSLTVVMPGDETPKFLAFPAPHVERKAEENFADL